MFLYFYDIQERIKIKVFFSNVHHKFRINKFCGEQVFIAKQGKYMTGGVYVNAKVLRLILLACSTLRRIKSNIIYPSGAGKHYAWPKYFW